MMNATKLADILTKAGFSKREIKALVEPTKNQYSAEKQDLNELWKTGLIQKAIKSRVKYIHQCRDEGWSDSEIKKSILAIDRNLESQANGLWAFLRIEYMIPANKSLSYKVAVKNRAKSLINQTAQGKMGVRYGKRGYNFRQPTVPYKVAVRPVNQPPLPL
jgi:hypothetical protein